ncbi:MAG: PadR family transcriptional regulator [Archaeoglobi archaeon]|nr:PadR family transcriptional regulator [Candidatus Mnemosynella sp.]
MERPRFRGELELLVLKLLEEGELHGYGMMVEMRRRYGIPAPSPGAIYPLLTSLRRRGLIEVAEEGEKEKKLYRISEKGRNYLEAHNEELQRALKMVNVFREFSELGGSELREVLEELIEKMDTLSDHQKEEISREISSFTRKIRMIILKGD